MWSICVVRISNFCFSQAYTTSEFSDSPVNTSHANCISYCRSCLRQTFFKALLSFLSSTKLVKWTKTPTRLFSFTRCDEPMTMSMECVLYGQLYFTLGLGDITDNQTATQKTQFTPDASLSYQYTQIDQNFNQATMPSLNLNYPLKTCQKLLNQKKHQRLSPSISIFK